MTFIDIVFVQFVDTLSVPFLISTHVITELSTILFKYTPLSQVSVLGFQK